MPLKHNKEKNDRRKSTVMKSIRFHIFNKQLWKRSNWPLAELILGGQVFVDKSLPNSVHMYIIEWYVLQRIFSKKVKNSEVSCFFQQTKEQKSFLLWSNYVLISHAMQGCI